MEKLIAAYIRLRDAKARLKEKHKQELEPLDTAMDKIESRFLAAFEKDGVQSVKTPEGTAYKQERVSIAPADWDAFLGWVRETEQWSCLERRVAKSAIEEVVAQTGDLPPGLNRRSEFVVNVRR